MQETELILAWNANVLALYVEYTINTTKKQLALHPCRQKGEKL